MLASIEPRARLITEKLSKEKTFLFRTFFKIFVHTKPKIK